MKKIILNTDAELLLCPICEKYKQIKKGVYEVRVAVNTSYKNSQHGVNMFSHWLTICADCQRKEVIKMSKGNKKGPPSGSKGPQDGRGGGEGNAPGKGIGKQKGGQRNIKKDEKK